MRFPARWGDTKSVKGRVNGCFGEPAGETYYVAIVQLYRDQDLGMKKAVTGAMTLIANQLTSINC